MEFWRCYQLEAGDMSCSHWRDGFSYRSDNYQTTDNNSRSWWHHKANGKSQVSGEASWKVVNPSHGLDQVCCLLWSLVWGFEPLWSHSNTAGLLHTQDWLRNEERKMSSFSPAKSICAYRLPVFFLWLNVLVTKLYVTSRNDMSVNIFFSQLL